MNNSTFLNLIFGCLNKTVVLLVLVLVLPLGLYADGTKQVMPSASASVEPVNGTALYFTRDLRGPFIDAPQANRLHFTIANAATENLYFAVKSLQRNAGANNPLINAATYYRIYNQAGVLVEGVNAAGVQVGGLSGRLDNGAGGNPVSGDPGYIDNYAQAFEGPNGLNGVTTGYSPLVFNPTTSGDFYIEFYISADGGATSVDFNGAGSNTPVVFFFPYFDLTVGTATTAIPGRLWSEKWSLIGYRLEDVNDNADGVNDPGLVPNPTLEASVEGEFFAYTDDQVIMDLDH